MLNLVMRYCSLFSLVMRCCHFLAHFFLSKREVFNAVNKAKFELLQQEYENKSIELRRFFSLQSNGEYISEWNWSACQLKGAGGGRVVFLYFY